MEGKFFSDSDKLLILPHFRPKYQVTCIKIKPFHLSKFCKSRIATFRKRARIWSSKTLTTSFKLRPFIRGLLSFGIMLIGLLIGRKCSDFI